MKVFSHNYPHKDGPHSHAPQGYRLLLQIFEKPTVYSRPDWPMEVVERIFRRSDAVFIKGCYTSSGFSQQGWMAFVPK